VEGLSKNAISLHNLVFVTVKKHDHVNQTYPFWLALVVVAVVGLRVNSSCIISKDVGAGTVKEFIAK
jgi:hypothetical protein